MISAEVKRLREAKEFQAAIQLGEQNLNDHATLIQVDWAYFGLIKQNITQFTSAQNPPFHLIKTITHNMWAYTKLPNRRANSSLSNIVRELGKIAPYLPEYLNFIDWVTNIDGWQKEDWQYSEFNGKYYAPIVCGVARNLAKWANQFQAIENDLTYILDWLRNTRMVAKGDDKLWLDWDSVKILKQLNRHTEATKILANVIKVKRNEFWVWQQAGQLYANEQPELARACFCRALSCGAKPEFSINVHSDLAQLLAQQGEYAWATAEILTVINIREQHGWRIPENLQKIMSQSWYDPSSTLPQTQPLYEQYSPEALVLCFDDVSEVAANFVTVFEIQDKGKKLAKFVYKNKQGQHISIVSKDWKSVKNYQSGKPVTLLIGMAENQQTQIMHISPRQSDTSWDCAKVVTGVVETITEKRIGLFIKHNFYHNIQQQNWQGAMPKIGDGVMAYVAKNPKKDEWEILAAQATEFHESDSIKMISGNLKRHEGGFAFLDNAFVAPHILQTLPENQDDNNTRAIAIYEKHPKKNKLVWRVIAFQAA